MRPIFNNSYLTLIAYESTLRVSTYLRHPGNAIRIHLCNDVRPIHGNDIANQTRYLYARKRIPICVFATIERELMRFIASLESEFVQYRDYDCIAAHNDVTYNTYLTRLLDRSGTDMASRRTMSKSRSYRFKISRGPYTWFVMHTKNVATYERLKTMVVAKLNKIVSAVVDGLPLSQLCYDQLVRAHLIDAYKQREADNESFQYALDTVIRTRIEYV